MCVCVELCVCLFWCCVGLSIVRSGHVAMFVYNCVYVCVCVGGLVLEAG